MSRNGWIIFIAICGLLLGGLIWMSRGNRVDVSGIDQNAILAASDDNGNIADHTTGADKGEVLIVEYGDFQCPGCGDAYPILKQIINKHDDYVTMVFRNFPLSSIHPNARAAAAAAEAAGLQGKYWQMHDRLYESQPEWSNLSGTMRSKMFANYAESLGLNVDKFNQDVDSDAVRKKLAFDASLGREAGVTGTPSIFVNGKEVSGYYKGDELVSRSTEGANPVWSNVKAFEDLVLLPALRDAGVDINNADDN